MKTVIDQAKQELEEEQHRQAVDEMKIHLRAKRWWHKLLPYKLIIIRRDT